MILEFQECLDTLRHTMGFSRLSQQDQELDFVCPFQLRLMEGPQELGQMFIPSKDLHHNLRNFVPPFLTSVSPALGKGDDFHPPWNIWQKAAPAGHGFCT